MESVAPPPNKKTPQNIPMLYISTPNGEAPGLMQHQVQNGPIRPRPSPPQQPIHLPQMTMQPGAQYPFQIPNGNTSKHPYPNPQLLSNHLKNFINNHNGPNTPSPNSYFPVPNRESQFNHVLNSSRNSPLNNFNINAVNNSLSPNQTNLLIPNQLKNMQKNDDIAFREPKGKERNINTCK